MRHRQTSSLPLLLAIAVGIAWALAWSVMVPGVHASDPSPREVPPAAQTPPREGAQQGSLPEGVLTKFEPLLLKQLLAGDPEDLHRVIIELLPRADLEGLGRDDLSHLDRQVQVVSHLQATARQSQAELLNYLQNQEAEGRAQEVRSFWVFNGLALSGDVETMLAVAARPEVRLIRQDRLRQWVEPPSTSDEQGSLTEEGSQWNIARVRADLAWSSLELDGTGVTVAIMDTGVDGLHPALQAQYRGYRPGGLSVHAGNWICTTDEGYLYPVDPHGHGTHVAGIAVGSQDELALAVGVAPGARWIGVKILNDAGYAYDSWIHAGFEWIMAPDGTPALAPEVVNGSWGSQRDADGTFRPDLQALRAAGIVSVFSAGNEGPDASSLRSPASYPEAIAVGATDDLDQVARFSSRGPSPWDEIKPEITAPGVQIRSSLPGGTFGAKNGTSMAAPHAAGVVALILQADPALSVDDVESILTATASPLSLQVPNNASGWGRVDAYRAAAVALQAGFVAGQVTRHPDQQPLPTALVTAYNDIGEHQATVAVDETGHYQLALPSGRYTVEAAAFGYETLSVSAVEVQATLTRTLEFQLQPAPAGVLWGQVTDSDTGGPVSVPVSVVGTPASATSDAQTGQYSLPLPAGVYDVEVAQNGYRRLNVDQVEIVTNQATRLDLSVSQAPTVLVVDSGRWYYDSQVSYYEQALGDLHYVYDLWEIRNLEADVPTTADLAPYELVVWSSPQDAPGLIGAGDVISDYLTTGGTLFLAGQDIGFWDDGLNGYLWHEYYFRLLKAQAVADNAGRSDFLGLPGEILDGLSLVMNGPDSAGNQFAPDSIDVLDPRDAALIGQYATDGGAALRASGCQLYRAVYLASGLEGLGDRTSRADLIERAAAWLGTPHPAVDLRLDSPRQEKVWIQGNAVTYTVQVQNLGKAADRFDLELSGSAWPIVVLDASMTGGMTQTAVLPPCQSENLHVQVTIPPDVRWNASDVVTLTVRSQTDPAHRAETVFATKAPAPILLVDDHRWFSTSDAYRRALDVVGLPYDVWQRDPPLFPDKDSPSLERLQRYPVTIWFTAYDWFKTLTPSEEARLATYLEAGGRLLLSSQDYLYTSGHTDFASDYLGVLDYTEGFTVTSAIGAVGNPVGKGLGPFELTYPFPNWSDALRPTTSAKIAFWGQHGQPAAITFEQAPWKSAFYAFPLESIQEHELATLVARTVGWLSALGDSSLQVSRVVAAPGDELEYTLLIRNTGPGLLSGVSLSNTVPVSVTYVPGSLQGPAEYDPASGRFSWRGSLDPGQTVTVTYRASLDASVPDGSQVRNTADLSDETGLFSRLIATSRVNTPDLSTSVKEISGMTVLPGYVLTYTLILRNEGLRPAPAYLSDPIPLLTRHRPGTASASSGYVISTEENLVWSGTISAGRSVTVTFPVTVTFAAYGLAVLNRATVNDGWGEVRPIEACFWPEGQLFLPLIFKHP